MNEGPFRDDAEAIMTGLFRQTKFGKCQEYLLSSLGDVGDRFGRLKAAAISLCETPEAPSTIAGIGEWTCMQHCPCRLKSS